GQRLVDVLLQRHPPSAPYALVGGDHEFALGIEDTVTQRVRGETAEHHRVDGADGAAGEHGGGRFGDHGHVDAHSVALADAALLEHVGQTADFLVHLTVGDVACVGGVGALPDAGGLVGAFLQ